MRINQLKPQLNRHEIAILLVSMMSPVAGMSAGMLAAPQFDHPWQQDAARIIGLLSGLIVFLLFGLKLFGSASSREAQEKLQAGVDRLEAGQKETNDMLKDLSAGQKETNDMLKDLSAGQKEANDMLKENNDMLKENTAVLKEILDVLKGGKGDGGGRSAAARTHEEPAE